MDTPVAARPDVAAATAPLNAPQARAVAHRGGPLLVIAGPGSGKTHTLAARVAALVQSGTDPNRLLLLTFSRRAAREMGRRAGLILQATLGLPSATPAPQLPWAGTFHAIGARLLREWAPSLGLAAGFTVLDRSDAEDLMALERQALGLAAQRTRFPLKGLCLSIYSRAVNSGQPLADLLTQQYPWCLPHAAALADLFRAYTVAKQRQQVLDYDDLLLVWAEAMTVPALAQALSARFDQILVDEVQDTNALQGRILAGLRPDGHGLTVVGDDAQSIYGFRAADVGQILGFASRFDPPATVVALEQNYRSTPALLAASNALIAQAAQRHPKAMWSALPAGPRPQLVTVADEAAQASWVADAVLAQREQGLALRQQAVLFRTAHHSAALELELARRRIPFVKFGGLKFMESTHVKDLLSLLRWAQNPLHTLAGYRCALLVPGIGPAHARRLLAALAAGAEPCALMRDFAAPPAVRSDWARFAVTWQALHVPGAAWPDAFETALAWYLPQLQRLHPDAALRAADLRQLQQMAQGYPSRERFLAELTLDPPQASSDEAGPPHRDDDYLVLSTIHAAKGQEWSAVHVLNVVDGCMPSDLATGRAAEIDEERRLLYVAMTRARRHLALLMPQRFHVSQQARWGDRHLYALPSRFLTSEVTALCDAVAGPVEPEAAALTLPVPADAGASIAQRLRDRWG